MGGFYTEGNEITLDPETIAAILAVLIPMIQDCLAKNRPEPEIRSVLERPTRRERLFLIFGLRRKQRRALRDFWNNIEDEGEPEFGLDSESAADLIEIAKEEAA